MKKIAFVIIAILCTQIAFGQQVKTPNVTFSKNYIKAHKGNTTVEILEVSELVNIIMALHVDAEKESNMFDTKSAYYKKIKNPFQSLRKPSDH